MKMPGDTHAISTGMRTSISLNTIRTKQFCSQKTICSAAYAAMVGGGPQLRPGLVTLAHNGVLFLDELAEFDRDVLDALRQPLEDGSIEIVRAHGHVRYPARLQLIAATNPCRCGWFGDPDRACRCPPLEPERYVRRVSGPLLDRIDLRIAMPRVPPQELIGGSPGEASQQRRRAHPEGSCHRPWRAHPGYPTHSCRGRRWTACVAPTARLASC